MMKISRNKIILTLYTFLVVFQPPFLPVSMIYITGFTVLMFLIYEKKAKLSLELLVNSKILFFIYTIIFIFLYLLLVSFIDANFIDYKHNLLLFRLKSINQLVLLTGFELVFVYYFLLKSREYNYNLKEILSVIIYAALLQSLLGLIAFISPLVRHIFLLNASEKFLDPYTFDRRGFGFSSILFDTFGYAMGLIAGYVYLLKDKCFIKNYVKKTIYLMLILFSIIYNSRTGIIIFLLSLLISLLKGNKYKVLVKVVITLMFSLIVYIFCVPIALDYGMNSSNANLRWITKAFNQMYYMINSGNIDFTKLSFISTIIPLPDNDFELFFGTGHNIYGSELSIIVGRGTDIGYINLLYCYGIVGTIFILSLFNYFFYYAYKKCFNSEMRLIALFNWIAYFVVLIKIILLGYNPGTCVTYLVTFSLIYYGEDKMKQIEIKNKDYSSYILI